MEKLLGIVLVGCMFMTCSCRNYVRETKTIYDENGIKFWVKVRGVEGIIYTVGPYIDFIAENNTSSDILYLKEVIMKVNNSDMLKFGNGDYYTNDKLVGIDFFLPLTISNNCSWKSVGEELPDANKFAPGPIPCVLTTKFQLNGVEKEVIREFEIKVR